MEASRTRAWVTLAALSIGAFLFVTVETLPIGLLAAMAGDLGVGESSIGLLVTAYGLVVVIATLPLVRLTATWPRRRLLVLLLAVFVVSTSLSALAVNYLSLLAARVVIALSQSVFWAVVTPAAAGLFPQRLRGRALSMVFAGASTAPLVGVPLGTWLGQQSSWRLPFLFLGLLGVLVLVVVLALLPETPRGASDADRGTAPDRGRYRTLVVASALAVAGAFAAFTYIDPFLTRVSGLDPAALGPILALRGIAGLLGVVVAGLVVGGWGWPSFLAATALQAVTLAVQFTFGASPLTAVITTAVAGFALSGTASILSTRVLEVAPGSTDMAAAGTSTAFNIGITAGALLGSGLLTAVGPEAPTLAGALLTTAAVLVVLAEPRLATTRRSRPLPEPAR
ncbi:MFS transporter [Paractinoplanes brasiliensis]|uniref:DHA1 family L-arabinose/isopropyl-beta-D-thiogalactopyranoside export protein-like MFS transporter n=1 Tax=Paractinoplanes brasiliensis TaxID=52695 RepID=A0A4R6JT01_9ACTN|nr:MFS transporter [Actinoplanes brasiliensis]TDO38902.1 DHA1 family L-arabinose/isopropyl-beta-D-thiogalactopyranoside export protein-like MFS transporter [Actinoplanes brasiliensis]GID26320.1 MFS transporter [Actinoplanes brasiliensis]